MACDGEPINDAVMRYRIPAKRIEHITTYPVPAVHAVCGQQLNERMEQYLRRHARVLTLLSVIPRPSIASMRITG